MRITIVYTDHETDIEQIEVIEHEHITINFLEKDVEDFSGKSKETFLEIKTSYKNISIFIPKDPFDIKEKIAKKILEDRELKLMVAKYWYQYEKALFEIF